MPEVEPNSGRKASVAEWVKLMMGGGFGVFIAYILVQALVGRDKSNTEFQQTTLIQLVAGMGDLKSEMINLKSEFVEMRDANSNLQRDLYPLTRQVDRLVKAVNEQVEQAEAEHAAEEAREQQ